MTDVRSSDRDVLFCVLAFRLDLLDPSQLLEALRDRGADGSVPLSRFVVGRGWLAPGQGDLLQRMIDAAVEAHGGDGRAAVAAVGADRLFRTALGVSIRRDATGVPSLDDSAFSGPVIVSEVSQEHPRRYSVRGEQGSGGQARIFLARDEHIGRDVALKELLGSDDKATAEVPLDGEELLRFMREARITGMLEHPSIVPVYEIGRRVNGALYYTMKLVRGKTLATALDGCASLRDRLRLLGHFEDLCQAVAYAHSLGVIHRDLKPGNVMIGDYGETVVLDWGLAKRIRGDDARPGAEAAPGGVGHCGDEAGPGSDTPRGHQGAGARSAARPFGDSQGSTPGRERGDHDSVNLAQTVAGSIMGTPAYMSPEQARGDIEAVDERSDVWGLGAVLYEILAGRPPVEGETLYDIVANLLEDPPVIAPVRAAAPQAPPQLAAVVDRALAPEPARRYQDAGEMAAEIKAFREGGFVASYRYSFWEVLRVLTDRHRNAVKVGLVAFVIIIALLVRYRYALQRQADDLEHSHFALQMQMTQVEHYRQTTVEMSRRLVTDFGNTFGHLAGTAPVRRRLARHVFDFYQENFDEHKAGREELFKAAAVHLEIAQMALDAGVSGLARKAVDRSLGLLDDLAASGSTDLNVERDRARACYWLGLVEARQGRGEQADQCFRRSVALSEGLAANAPGSASPWRNLVDTRQALGNLERARGKADGARDWYLGSLEALARARQLDPSDAGLEIYESRLHRLLAKAALLKGDTMAGRKELATALAGVEGLARRFPLRADYQLDLADCLLLSGRFPDALVVYQRLRRADLTSWRYATSVAEGSIACRDYRSALDAAGAAVQVCHEEPYRRLVALVYAAMAADLLGDATEARRYVQEAVAMLQLPSGADSATEVDWSMGWSYHTVAVALRTLGTPVGLRLATLLDGLEAAQSSGADRRARFKAALQAYLGSTSDN